MKKELIEFMALFQSSSFKSIPKSLFNTDVVFSIVSLVSEDDILLKSGNVVIKKLGIWRKAKQWDEDISLLEWICLNDIRWVP